MPSLHTEAMRSPAELWDAEVREAVGIPWDGGSTQSKLRWRRSMESERGLEAEGWDGGLGTS